MMHQAGPHLRDIHLPPAPGWWPLAPGWWVLAAIVLLCLGWLVWRFWRARRGRRQWLATNRELDALLAAHAAEPDAAAFAAGVSQLLRRAARVRDPASASRSGRDWHQAMHELAGREPPRILWTLEEAMYRPDPQLDAGEVAAAARPWLRRVLRRGGRHA